MPAKLSMEEKYVKCDEDSNVLQSMDRRLFFPQEKGVGLLAHLDALADRRMLPPLTGMSWIPILLPFLRV